jgi:hypothetical protein
MANAEATWKGNWQARIQQRLNEMGFSSMSEFLAHFPGEPYIQVANRLGENVAGAQIVWMQNKEATSQHAIKLLAMDALSHELNYHLENGWGIG